MINVYTTIYSIYVYTTTSLHNLATDYPKHRSSTHSKELTHMFKLLLNQNYVTDVRWKHNIECSLLIKVWL